MIAKKPPMGWNSWNTFGDKINEQLIKEMADRIVEDGYRDLGYEYIIIDDCWSLRERVDGKLVADPALFPNGMKALADYIHSKGLKFGMYSCAGTKTCAGYPSSYGHEFSDAKQFAEWGVYFPVSGDAKNAYLTMAMALRSTGRDILFAACNWGMYDPSGWMRSHGAHSYRSTGDIFDGPKSYKDLFISQVENVENNAPGCWNDMDMLIVGMHGNGNVGIGGCSDLQYLQHFAMWAFLGSPLIIGADLRKLDEANKKILFCKGLIEINQDEECRPPFLVDHDDTRKYTFAKLMSGNRIAIAFFNLAAEDQWTQNVGICFDDLGIHSESGIRLQLTDAITGEDLGIYEDSYATKIAPDESKVIIAQLIFPE